MAHWRGCSHAWRAARGHAAAAGLAAAAGMYMMSFARAAVLADDSGAATAGVSTGTGAAVPVSERQRRLTWRYKPVPNPRQWIRSAKDGDDAALRTQLGMDGHTCATKLDNMLIFSGSSNPSLADEIAYELHATLGRVKLARYADGEVDVQVLDNVRGKDVFIVQSTSQPVNEHIIELLLMISTMRRASARTITAVIPYYGYKRDVGSVTSLASQLRAHTHTLDSDVVRGVKSELIMQTGASPMEQGAAIREMLERAGVGAQGAYIDGAKPEEDPVFPVSAADVAVMFESMGVDRILSVELQPPGQGHLEGFFPARVSVENIRSTAVAVEHLSKLRLKNPVIVAPNESCIHLANDVAAGMSFKLDKHVGIAVMVEAGPSRGMDRYVHRPSADAAQHESTIELVGDVSGHDVIVVDDMLDTGNTLMHRLRVLKERGAQTIVAFATHGLFNGEALQKITKSPLAQMIVTNTVALRDDVDTRHTHKIAQLSVAPIVAEAVLRVQTGQSLESLRSYGSKGSPRYLGQE